MRFNRKILIISGGIAVILIVVLLSFWKHKNISIIGITRFSETPKEKLSSVDGLPCARSQSRVIGVMMPSDAAARPLSGIGSADIVFEMPVTPNGITRMLAGFQCDTPTEIGSIRSAREDFLPLAGGLKVIYAHWGGEHGVLAELDQGVLDNLDGLTNGAFFRKPGIPQPHNGFTTISNIEKYAQQKNYSLTDTFAGYPHSTNQPSRNLSNLADSVTVNYSSPYDVAWKYDEASGTYSRSRGGTPEIDKLTAKQVTASVVIVMKTTSRLYYDQYIRVDTTGQGDASIYQDGVVIGATWHKDPASLTSKLTFTDSNGKEISFVPGKIWVEVIAENT